MDTGTVRPVCGVTATVVLAGGATQQGWLGCGRLPPCVFAQNHDILRMSLWFCIASRASACDVLAVVKHTQHCTDRECFLSCNSCPSQNLAADLCASSKCNSLLQSRSLSVCPLHPSLFPLPACRSARLQHRILCCQPAADAVIRQRIALIHRLPTSNTTHLRLIPAETAVQKHQPQDAAVPNEVSPCQQAAGQQAAAQARDAYHQQHKHAA